MKKLTNLLFLNGILLSLLSFSRINRNKQVKAVDEMSSIEFVESLGVGYNLGNALNGDAKQLTDSDYLQTIYKPLGFSTFELFMEARDLPTNRRAKINQNMVDAIYDKGFRSVRLPISWSNHMDSQGNISTAWMNRIKEVTDMFLSKQGMSVILTLMESPVAHHYGDKSYNLSDDYFNQSNKLVADVWRQVGNTFKTYGRNLVFENLNEPQYDHDHRWNFYFTTSGLHDGSLYKEANENLMALNQTFVDTVRAAGGENVNRFLTVNTIGNIPELAYDNRATSISAFKMPTDTATDKLIFNAHAYTPKKFTYYKVQSGCDEAIFQDTASVDAICQGLKTNFIDKGIGTIISEWGSVEDSSANGRHASRIDHARYYMEKATLAGIGMYVWDNADMDAIEGGEAFGFLNRFAANGTYKTTTIAGTEMDNSKVWYHEDVLMGLFEGYDNAQDELHPVDPVDCSFVFVGDYCTMNNLSSYTINSVVQTKITAKSGYKLPDSITVVGSDAYTYDKTTGAFRVKIKQNMVVMCNAIKVEPVMYDLYFIGEYCSLNNKSKYAENSVVNLKITPYVNYQLPDTITVQGSSDYTYDKTTGDLQIKMTENTVIVCNAIKKEGVIETNKYTFTFIGDHCYLNNGTTYDENTVVNFTFTVDKNYELPDTIKVKGINEYTYSKENKTFSAKMTGDVIVVAYATKIVKPVTNYFSFVFVGEDCLLNNEDRYEEGSEITLNLTANEGYRLPSEITIHGVSDYTYNKTNGELKLKVTSSVVVVAKAVKIEITPEPDMFSFNFVGEHCSINNLDSYQDGTNVSLVLTPDEGYKLPDTITVVGATNYLYSKQTGTIEFTIKNNIVLVANAIKESNSDNTDEEKDTQLGCLGDIASSSILIVGLSSIGLALMLFRKRRFSK